MRTETHAPEAPFSDPPTPIAFCPDCGSPNVQKDDEGAILYCRACRSNRERLALGALANVRHDLQDALRFLTVNDDVGTAEEKIREALGRCQEVFEDWGSA